MRLKHYFLRHTQVGLGSLGQLSRAPFASLMTCFIIGIALALPAALFIVLKNAEAMSQHFQQAVQLTLYLKKEANEAQAQSLSNTLKTQNGIHSVQLISPAQGLKELQQQEGFESLIDELPANPLPWAVVVLPNTATHIDTLTQRLKQLPAVDSVQLDMTWIKRLETLVELAHRIVSALAIFLGCSVFLIVNNAIRSATEHHQKEIEIIKLIGGTSSFIRRPFLYAGAIYGLLGGIIAWQLVDIFLLLLRSPIHRLTELYSSSFQLATINLTDTLFLLGGSMALGLAGAWLAVTRHLHTAHA